ncbi:MULTISPECIES: DEAD/DEAH box helicase family protein [Actinomycetes]|uniref:DEAD/DEAH box helicase family protein n=1 Tax=Actinomycetes TaxID=1760 RepID=UPI000C7FBDD3|nr:MULTISPECIES: DEAD/DEAH box helicase family protein [Actinomycetes]MCP9184824.1 DEAD/DEAH box helicase family protein [Acinetobacter baumannii]MBM7795642.1 type III restriction enzyme [Pseudoglutamicibacter cumminsii]NHX53063.1 restriction endonuclease [Corynebacterium striatum]NHY37675.1 restriction endonuclease [Corynebacterium striatum]WIK63942.1 DEAD/DEAH box helicase family protein [Gleimia hominis]
MELKKYQNRVIADLEDYLTQLNEQPTLSEAFKMFWESRQIEVGTLQMPGYQNVIDGVPHVCYKVPTGGGKTFLACASVKPIFEALPPTRKQAVVWLVPSDSILTQTLAALKNSSHPYRQKLNTDFGGRVEVYSKEELLAGQNFSPSTVAEQLSVMVLSYDSFRSRTKDGRKAYQANGNLASFSTAFGAPEQLIENADETALFQVINQLNPVVIVDESHHATSTLSQEMLTNFNPAFILDLTATPKRQANVISYVDALSLKNESMVKLPVIAYNRSSQKDVVTDAIDLRRSLEVAATQQYENGGAYIRPIVLFQAQPKTSEDATSFERLRDKLVKAGIPAEQIAIKTADVNELKGVDLLSEECPIRFIITVNALKEGWDCPFAYILASLANKTSQVDVEQILGRVLRQPHAKKQPNTLLNMSYVLTSSNDFGVTLKQIVAGLNSAGFSKRDFRTADQVAFDFTGANQSSKPAPTSSDSVEGMDVEEFLEFDEEQVAADLDAREESASSPEPSPDLTVASMIEQAAQQGADYEQEAEEAAQMGEGFVPSDLEDAVDTSFVNPEFADEIETLRLPQFVIQEPGSALFPTAHEGYNELKHEALAGDFDLATKDIDIDLSTADEQMYKIDVRKDSEVPKAFRMSSTDQKFMREHFSKLSIEGQKRNTAEAIYQRIKPINSITDSDLRAYIVRTVEAFGTEQLLTYQEHPHAVASKVKQKIDGLLEAHKVKRFYEDIETRRVDVQQLYAFPKAIQPIHASSLIGGSLYGAEDKMNGFELELAGRFSGMDNVRWWHRVIERKGFCLNGPFNHYPDFVVMTASGTIVVVETKGEHLKNDDSNRKIRLGRAWANMSGNGYRYYMVFEDGVTPPDGAVTLSELVRILEKL